jgi:hypothetical protein
VKDRRAEYDEDSFRIFPGGLKRDPPVPGRGEDICGGAVAQPEPPDFRRGFTGWRRWRASPQRPRRGGLRQHGDVPPRILRATDARGGFSGPVYSLLLARPDLVAELSADILEEHFEPSFHEDILDAVGVPWIAQLVEGGLRNEEVKEKDLAN